MKAEVGTQDKFLFNLEKELLTTVNLLEKMWTTLCGA